MNNPKSSNKQYYIIGGIVVVALVAYFYWQGNTTSTGTATLDQTNADNQVVGVKVFSLLNEIKSLKIDSTLFSDTAYMTLKDYSVEVPTLPVGRPNPFAPIPGVTNPSAQTSSVKH